MFLLMLNASFISGCATATPNRRRGDELQLPNVGDFQYFPEYIGNEINAVGFLIVLGSLFWLMKSLISNSKLKELLIYTNSGASLLMLFGGTLTTIELYKLVSHRMIDFRLYVSPSNTSIDWQDINTIEGNIYGISDAVSFIIFFFFVVFIWSQTFPNKSNSRHRKTFLTERNARQGMLILLASTLFFVIIWSTPLVKNETDKNSNNTDIAFEIKSRRLHYTPDPTLKRYVQYKKELKAIIAHNASLFTCADGVKVTDQMKCYPPAPTPQFECWNGDMVFNSGQCPINYKKMREEREAAVKLAHKKFQQIEGKGPLSEFDKFLSTYSSFQELSEIVKTIRHQKNMISRVTLMGTENECTISNSASIVTISLQELPYKKYEPIPPEYEEQVWYRVAIPKHRTGAIFETVSETIVLQDPATVLRFVPAKEEVFTDYIITNLNDQQVAVFNNTRIARQSGVEEELIPAKTDTVYRKVIKIPGDGNWNPEVRVPATRRLVKKPASIVEVDSIPKILTVEGKVCD